MFRILALICYFLLTSDIAQVYCNESSGEAEAGAEEGSGAEGSGSEQAEVPPAEGDYNTDGVGEGLLS